MILLLKFVLNILQKTIHKLLTDNMSQQQTGVLKLNHDKRNLDENLSVKQKKQG